MEHEKEEVEGIKSLTNSILLLKNSIIQFHWPRADFDQLLSVKIKHSDQESTYNWSGGFTIDHVNSFHLNMRHIFSPEIIIYLKVDILLNNGTFYIVFSDQCDFPFPVRIENHSEISVYFLQSSTLEEQKYNINVKPKQALEYSWDEPIHEKKLLIGVKSGTKEIVDLDDHDKLKHLYYENFFYICFIDGCVVKRIIFN
jgi:vacuolar protein sorting-associated protein 13D